MYKYSAQKLDNTAPSNKLAEKSLKLINSKTSGPSQVKILNKSINYLHGLEIGLKFPNATWRRFGNHAIYPYIAQLESAQLPEGQEFCLKGSANIRENTT